MRVDQEQEGIVANRLAFKTLDIDRVAAQEHPETADKGRIPLLVAHLIAAWIEPHHVANLRTADPPTLEKFRPSKNRMLAPKLDEAPGEFEERFLFVVMFPVEPADLVILAIGVV